MIITNSFVKKCLSKLRLRGITIWPFIFIRDESLIYDEVLINHEEIHLKQEKELFLIGFYILYLWEYVNLLWFFKNSYLAYRHISFEQEAFSNEKDLEYIVNRKKFSWINYKYN